MASRLASLCYFLLGAGLLSTWNAFISAVDYFAAIYGSHMDRLFTVCYLPMCLLLLLIMLHLGPAVCNPHARITVGFIGFIGVCCAVPLIDWQLVSADGRASPAALAVVLGAVLATGVFDGVSQGAVFVDASAAGPQYTQAAIGGTAVSGILITAIRVVTKATAEAGSTDDGVQEDTSLSALRRSTSLYFLCAAVLAGAGLVAHTLVLPRLGVRSVGGGAAGAAGAAGGQHMGKAKHSGYELASLGGNISGGPSAATPPSRHIKHVRHSSEAPGGGGGVFTLEGLEDESSEDYDRRGDNSECNDDDEEARPLSRKGRGGGANGGDDDIPVTQASRQRQRAGAGGPVPSTGGGGGGEHAAAAARARRVRMALVARAVWPCLGCLVVTYIATLSVFPGVVAEDVHSESLGDWYPILLIALFNLSDAFGKLIPISTGLWANNQYYILAAAMIRVFLILPPLLLAAIHNAHAGIMSALVLVLGASNGYLTALTLVIAPSFAANADYTSLAPSSSGGRGMAGSSLSVPAAADGGGGGGGGEQQSVGDLAEDLCVVALVCGLTLGALLGWGWLLLM
ncbi:hypothetical protein FOA52_013608 [Chlamydomonas sp. UWO 241]|nr:hypothetical protein FOA52_013608 [Chlamydomonas sp. UWO 241]